MMRNLINLILFVMLANSAVSQTRDNVWFDGDVFLIDGQSLSGKLNYNIREQIIQIKIDTVVQKFEEGQIKKMSLTYKEFSHEFLPILIKDESDSIRSILVEVFYKSPNNYSYIKRHQANIETIFYYGLPKPADNSRDLGLRIPLRIKTKANPNKDSFTSNENQLSRRKYIPLLIDYKGNHVRLERQSLLETLEDKKKEIKKFIRSRQLKLYVDDDVVKILEYYDKIKD